MTAIRPRTRTLPWSERLTRARWRSRERNRHAAKRRQSLRSRQATRSRCRNPFEAVTRADTPGAPRPLPSTRPTMRPNVGGACGVQDSLERRPEPRGGIELEPRNLRVERRVVVAHEMIVAFHVAAGRLEDDEAL